MSSPAATGGRDRSPSGHGVLASAVPTAPPAAVGEASPAGSGRPPSLPPPTPDSSVYGSHTRICAAPECNRILGSAFHDLHNVCITCRHDICSVDARCTECLPWPPDLVAWARKHQLYLQRRCAARSRRRDHGPPPVILSPVEPPDSALVGAEAAESLSGSLDPHDSISQAPESSHGYGPSLSSFLESFSAFFGFDSDPPCKSFQDMVSKLVAEQCRSS